ncbi:hypothetical protein DTL42_03155 [Bremerella cremea]|uniref:Uncharacterized protein n=2 Tax=Bremerella cremea TaxID=1031537 RepID=A0A368KV08_9BACT|nr:hypothetical protein DTL42_03155 [Bremerella cremea]
MTILTTVSLSLILSLFSDRKLAFVPCCLAAFGGAYSIAPRIFSNPPVWVRGYTRHDFLRFDLLLLVGMTAGLSVALFQLNRWPNLYWIWPTVTSLLLSGLGTLAAIIVGELGWRLVF